MSEPLEQVPSPTTQPATVPTRPSGEGSTHDPRRKSPFLAGFLSLMPGLGQIYVGYYQRGFLHALVVGVLLSILTEEAAGPLMALGTLFLTFFWFYNVIDAVRRAALYNYALAGGADIELPEDFKVPSLSGSVAGGVTLMAVGLVLLGNTAFGMSLAWVEQWWPVAFIVFGGYLAWKAKQGGSRPAADRYEDDPALD